MGKCYIIDAKRTAIGKFLGSLYESEASEVCSQIIKNGLCRDGKYLKDIQEVIFGNVISAGMGQGIARKIAITAGIPEQVPAYTVGMVCGSGMQAIINGVKDLECGDDLVLCGGLEFMSNIPYATKSYIRLGKKFGDFTMIDLMTHDGLLDSFSGVHMGVTAENIAKEYGITRVQQDEYAFKTQQRAIDAIDSGKFKGEIVPIHLKDHKGREYVFEEDEYPNRTSTIEKMASLKPMFVKNETGTVTAANTSGINDGAAFLLLATEEYCKHNNVHPLCEIMAYDTVGCNPQLMGLGPYYSITRLLKKTNKTITDIDYFEINEAFAAQVLGCYKLLAREFHVTEEEIEAKCNIYGSGLGLGHPLGATGARIVTTLSHILNNNGGHFGVASLCIGGGMGASVLIRKVEDDEYKG